MTRTCRCCHADIPQPLPHVEILVSQERPRRGMHASGRVAAIGCPDCASSMSTSILRIASLWTPSGPCEHRTSSLFQ